MHVFSLSEIQVSHLGAGLHSKSRAFHFLCTHHSHDTLICNVYWLKKKCPLQGRFMTWETWGKASMQNIVAIVKKFTVYLLRTNIMQSTLLYMFMKRF